MDKELKLRFKMEHISMFKKKLLADIDRNFENLDTTVVVLLKNEIVTLNNEIYKIVNEENGSLLVEFNDYLEKYNEQTSKNLLEFSNYIKDLIKKEVDSFDDVEDHLIKEFVQKLGDIYIYEEKTNDILVEFIDEVNNITKNVGNIEARVHNYMYNIYLYRVSNLINEQFSLKKHIIINSIYKNYEHYQTLQNN